MSLINFLSSKLNPKVTCESVCEDGYEPSNLIASNTTELATGFQAYSVTKPPINLEFEFSAAVQVKQIKLWNTSRAFRSTGFEVYGRHIGDNECFEKIANVFQFQGDSLLFCFARDQQNSTVSSQTHEKILFFKNAARVLAAATQIRITIKATANKCPAVLKRIEVWGMPAKCVASPKREMIKTAWRESLVAKRELFYCSESVEDQLLPCDESAEEETSKNATKKCPVPDDFQDAITCELMVFPTVLPSGKTVDQSTIDRHSVQEAQWGRSPSDPFTGVPYTRQRKPVLDFPLKARIEKFLLDNSEHFKTVPRTLGQRNPYKRRNNNATSTEISMKKPKVEYLPSYAFGVQPISTVDAALELTLKKITRYTRLQEVNTCSESNSCISCQHLINLYRIKTCNHLVCRNCLNNFSMTKVCSCKMRFSSADVSKFHAT